MKSNPQNIVFPGSVLCMEEEFACGPNTAALNSGDVVSTTVGVADLGEHERMCRVASPFRQVIGLERGAVVFGRVVLVKENVAVVELASGKKSGVDCAIPNSTAAIPVSLIREGFVKTAKDQFRIGDIVKARVASVASHGVDLTTNGFDLGCVVAYCIRCRQPLRLINRELKCLGCGSRNFRKFSSEYALK